ncbi:Aflatoxin B1 aldehyde reductase member 2 [Cladochytrium tenue]|nr:Aflatoxin B1 aldehyde reductase member 2 [Cladochytrium tenue]
MTAATAPKIVFGAANNLWNSEETDADALLAILAERGVHEVDSARGYGPSEERIGERRIVDKGFVVHTKHPGGFSPVGSSKQAILDYAATSFQLLKLDQVDIYYLHSPDRKTPIEDTLSGIQELYTQGRFKRFGLSNFLPHEVEEVVRVAREKGYVLPTVYQGNYNAVARGQEPELFPVLRKHGITFYAYSPLAGGFLTKSKAQFEAGAKGAGRFVEGGGYVNDLYRELYLKPKLLDALDSWAAISQDAGVSRAELAYRWVRYHSALRAELGDAVIIGASTLDQLRETLVGLDKGPLPADIVRRIESVWEDVKDEASLDNFNSSSLNKA